ncbi:amidase signature domain-containing protein [Dactylonectria estremocensis]|uniref:Amidase signature domain-containing protein n=1 Tax=Dactylonectria estremocensis TaxID=1079267 RepID=A0A9P9J662_9HYPO|nr:amidase signature domain-containing protein [Dactylonectria estremocensis]
MATLNLVETTIDELAAALSSGNLTSVELVAHYLRRISRYDCRGITLNSIPILNLQVFDDAAASDDRRASGQPVRRLEGIPFTVKDSYKVKGMTVASGSPAFKDLVATEDAFTVSAIRAEGGVLIGRTNMPPMAYGGMQRGIYGRAESPYNPDYLAATFISGSSNGSAVSTVASFAAFGMGEETVSSGRSPASNNALVAYTPSQGYISIRGNWPLYPTCDVVVPHTRTIDDMLVLLEVITVEDHSTRGDFWRDKPFSSFADIPSCTGLKGVRFAVPAIEAVINLWKQAKYQLESLGAEVVIVPDFPAVTAYENAELIPEGSPRLPEDWNWTERGPLVARRWDLFLRDNKDPGIFNLTCVDEFNIYPQSMRTPAELKHLPASNAIHWGKLASYALNALEDMRKHLLDEYLQLFNCDCFVFPAAGEVGASDADVDDASAAHAWTNGVFYSNGNRALRHLGIPSVTVPMGIIPDKQIPMGLTFAGRAYDDTNLLKWANAFEKKTKMRVAPVQTPPLHSDYVELSQADGAGKAKRPVLVVEECVVDIKGTAQSLIQIMVDGEDVPPEKITINKATSKLTGQIVFQFGGWALTPMPVEKNEREKTMVPVVYDKNMVVILVRSAPGGYSTGFLGLI